MPGSPSSSRTSPSLDDLIGGRELLKLVVQRISSQILLFSIAIIVFVLAAFFLFDDRALEVSIVIIFVFIVGTVGYLFVEERRKLRREEPETVNRALGVQMAAIVKDDGESAASELSIRLEVQRIAPEGARDVVVRAGPTAGNASSATGTRFQIGDRVNVCFEANRECYLTLLNVGTSGKLTVLFPNGMHPQNRIPAGERHEIPGDSYGFEYVLEGPPGTERLKAVATLSPVPLLETSFAPDGSLFLQEAPSAAARDIAVVKERTKQLSPTEWAEAHLEFDVVP